MSRIAGIFYFDFRPVPDGDSERVSSALESADFLPVRIHKAPGLIMGHAVSFADPSLENACCASPDGSFCTWDGRLDNREELADALGDDLKSSVNGADFALRSFLRGGDKSFEHLIGDWSLAIWDEQTRSVILASDFAGIRPLYYCRKPDRLVWATSLSELLHWVGPVELDEEYVATFLTNGGAANRTPYKGIRPVPPGYAVRIGTDRISMSAFWDLPGDRECRLPDERDYEEQLRGLLRDAVRVRLARRGPTCAELSGGLDSSSIVCMAKSLKTGDSGQPPRMVTFSYRHQCASDEKYFRAVEHHLRVSGIHLALDKFPFAAPNQIGQSAPSWWEPRFRELARQMALAGSTVLLTGQLGDLIMGNSADDSDQVADYLRNAQFLQAAREAFAWSQSLRVPIYSILWQALRSNCSSWAAPGIVNSMCDRYGKIDSLAPEFRKRVALSDYEREQQHRWHAAPPSRRRSFRALTEMLSSRMLQVPETLQHISYTHPYTHRPLLEFMLTIPRNQVCRPGEPRRLMRRALARYLPPIVLKRKSKGVYNVAYREALLPFAADLLRKPADIRIVEYGYVDRRSFLERLTRFADGLDCNESQLRQLILLEFWLRGGAGPAQGVIEENALHWVT